MIAQHYKDMLGAKSVIRQISEWSTARGAQIGYENVFDYSLGNPSVPCPPQFTAACENLLQNTDPVTLHGYTPTLTLPSARKAVAESLNRRFGMDYTADHIFMTTGAAGALAHAVCLDKPVTEFAFEVTNSDLTMPEWASGWGRIHFPPVKLVQE